MFVKDKQKEIVNRIIEKLESGVKPWEKPYLSCHVQNLQSGHQYSGGNWFILSMLSTDYFFLTFNQVQELGGKVRKGSHSLPVFFYSRSEDKVLQDGTISEGHPFIKCFNLFGLSDCEIPEEKLKSLIEKRGIEQKDNKRIESFDQFVQATKAEIRTGSGIPHYNIEEDYIMLPDISFFKSSEAYAHTLSHELVHYTGHQSRLNRFDVKDRKAASNHTNYGIEELIAETGAAFITNEFNIQDEEREAAYLGGWIKAIKEDYKILFQTMKKATEALDYLKQVVLNNIESVQPSEKTEEVNESVVTPEAVIEAPKVIDVVEEPASVPEIKPAPSRVPNISKTLNVALLKKYITNATIQLQITKNQVKFFGWDSSVIIFDVKIDADCDYIIAVNPIRKDLKKCKGKISFRDSKIITDSIIVPFESLEENETLITPVAVPDTGYKWGFANKASKIIHCSAADTIKPVFHSVCFSGDKIITTDSRRLGIVDFMEVMDCDLVIDHSVIDIAIRDKLNYIAGVTLQEKPDICIVDVHYAVITNMQDVTIVSREVEGQFPNFKAIIPDAKSIVQTFKFNPTLLSAFLQFKKGTVIFKDNTLTHRDTGHSIELPFKSDLEFGVNAEFLQDCFKNQIQISISVTGVMSPVMFKAGNIINILMPIQLKSKEQAA